MKYDTEPLIDTCCSYLDNDEQIPIDIVFECVKLGIDVSKLEHNHSLGKDICQTESTQ
jgi:hypothetical protein